MPKERRRRYTNYSRPQSYLDPLRPGEGRAPRANISRTLLEEVRFAGEELQESRDEINAFKSAQKQREFDLQEKILKTKSIEKDNPMNTLTPQLNAMVNDVQKAYLDGFKSGDMSLAEDKERNVNRAVDTILGVTAALDTESKKIQDMSAEEAEKVILHSQFAGDDGMVTPEDRKKYLELLKDPSKLGYRYENGDWVIQLKTDGGYVDLFNGNEYKNAYEKDGFALIKTADNYDEEIKTLDAEVSKGLDALKTKTIETKIASGKATTTELIDYSEAVNTYRDRLENNLSLEALINESNYQRFVPKNQRSELDKSSPSLLTRKKKYMQFSDDPSSASYKKTKEELINYMVSQRYPSSELVARTVIKPEDKKASGSKSSGKEAPTTIDHSDFISGLSEYNKLIKADTGLQTLGFSDSLRKQRMQYLTDYMMKKNALFKGDNAAVLAQNKKADPNSYYEYTDPKGTYKDAYTIVDVEKVFTDAVFEDPASLERKLNRYIKGGTVGTSRVKK